MENKFELIGTRMLIGFINFKQILPALGSIKLKTKYQYNIKHIMN